ncbi:MAG: FTR1 family protein [bacterium]|nr:FTR1 family protein [bacterium]
MLANYLIGLREGLEASLVVAMLVAYIVKLERRSMLPRLWAGVGLAILLSLGVGAFLQLTSQTLTFQAQEAFGGFMSLLAVGLITWMIFWMASHAKGIRAHLHGEIDKALLGGAWTLTIVAFVSVGREGLETALFLWAGITASGETVEPIIGAVLGLATAVVLGFIVYKGAVRLNMQKLFAWTGAGLIIVAAGVLAYGLHDLQEAAILPGLNNLAFDVSAQIPPGSWYGTLLKGVFNFSPATTWLEFVAWWAYVLPTMFLYIRMLRKKPAPRPQQETHVEVPSA